MDVKDLNKPQLILLAVLLSFVTSIATGITTVTLMQQAPASFTVPVNRVVQQTIEKIQQVEGKTTVQTVIIKEEDLVVDAIAKNKSAIFTITKEAPGPNSRTIVEVPAGKGFAVSKDGTVVTDASAIWDDGVYFIKNDSGKFKADFVSTDPAGFSILKAGASVNSTDKLTFTVPNFGDLDKIKIGQKILVLGSGVSSFIFDGNKDIKASVTKLNEGAGAIVLDLDGNVLGMALSGENTSFASISAIANVLKLSINPAASLPAVPVLTPQGETKGENVAP